MNWTYCDNLVVYYFYRFGNCRTHKNHLGLRNHIVSIINKTEGSVNMKIKNYNFLNAETPALANCSAVSVEIFNRFSVMDNITALRIMSEECAAIRNLIN